METLSEMIVYLHEKRFMPYDILASLLGVDINILIHSNNYEGSWELVFVDYQKFVDVSNKIVYLCYINDDSDSRIQAFLNVLLDYHHIPIETIASFANVKEICIQQFLQQPTAVDLHIRYAIAAVVMSLRYISKDSEERQ